MRYVRGSWRTFISIEDAVSLEKQIKEYKTYTVDDRNPAGDLGKSRCFSRTYQVFLNPKSHDVIREGTVLEVMLLPAVYYHAVIRLGYDYRNDPPICQIDINETSFQLLESYLWICNANHKVESRVLPETKDPIVRCAKCGNKMKCIRKPIMPHLRHELERMGNAFHVSRMAQMTELKPENQVS